MRPTTIPMVKISDDGFEEQTHRHRSDAIEDCPLLRRRRGPYFRQLHMGEKYMVELLGVILIVRVNE
ncbi:hypothetical protein Hdeb2414_s0009g00304531 [Helianthus debilis subsp. tardiflorus]